MYILVCKECKREFQSVYATNSYCSKECQLLATRNYGKYERLCRQCEKIFRTNSTNACYCGPECREKALSSMHKPSFEKTCICGKVFTTNQPAHKYCSKECLAVATRENTKLKTRNQQKNQICDADDSSFEGIHKDLISDIIRQFRREKDFQDFINQFYYLFGLRNILKSDPYFPDIIALDSNNVRQRIEVEYHAYNFIAHKHDPLGCDFIYSIYSNVNTVKNIPVRYFFKTSGISDDNIIGFGNILLPLHYDTLPTAEFS